MISITTVIRTRSGEEETMRRALLDVARHVPEAEPGEPRLLRLPGYG
jgi:hypothetical protein